MSAETRSKHVDMTVEAIKQFFSDGG